MYPPRSDVYRVSDASSELFSLDEAKLYLKVEHDADDLMVSLALGSARQACEAMAGQTFLSSQWRLTLDRNTADLAPTIAQVYPYAGPYSAPAYRPESPIITLPFGPLISIDGIEYLGPEGDPVEVPSGPASGIRVWPGMPGRVGPGLGTRFPFYGDSSVVSASIVYTSGFGDEPGAVPLTYRMAVLQLTAHFFENRSAGADVPDSVRKLIDLARPRIYV